MGVAEPTTSEMLTLMTWHWRQLYKVDQRGFVPVSSELTLLRQFWRNARRGNDLS